MDVKIDGQELAAARIYAPVYMVQDEDRRLQLKTRDFEQQLIFELDILLSQGWL